jgi:2,4-dienoyl-CoA reductase (NADPH2)
VLDGDELRGILLGGMPSALAKLGLVQRLLLRVGRLSQLLRSIRILRFASRLWMPIADEVVIIGGGLVGLELAEYLVERDRKVTVLEPGPALGTGLAIVRRARVLHCLREAGAVLYRSVEQIEIGPESVSFVCKGKAGAASAGHVLVAMGAEPGDKLCVDLPGAGASVHSIGDCRHIGYIDGAILDARELVQKLESV